MKRRWMTMMMAAMFTLASGMFAQTADPGACPNCPNGGVPKQDGTGKQAKRGQKKGSGPGMQGQRTGPRDGTGPMHTPSGQGRRGGRR